MNISEKGQYYGEEKKMIKSSGVILSEYHYFAKKVDWHYHENPYFMYVIEGHLLDINKKRTFQCEPGTLLLHNWQEPHSNARHTETSMGFHIEFERSWLDQYLFNFNLLEGSSALKNPLLLNLISKIRMELHQNDLYSDLAIEDLLVQICTSVNNPTYSKTSILPSWVSKIKEIIHDHTEQVSLTTLAQMLNIHPVHLSTAFPKYFKTTLSNYIRQTKVHQSICHLEKNHFSLTEIAYICGFSDQSHYTRCFKKYFNLSPKKYRQLIHNK